MAEKSRTRTVLRRKDKDVQKRLIAAFLVRRELLSKEEVEEAQRRFAQASDQGSFLDYVIDSGQVERAVADESLGDLRDFLEFSEGKRGRRRPYGLLAVSLGILTEEQLADLLERQHTLRQKGQKPPMLGQIAVGLGYLSDADTQKVRDAQRPAVVQAGQKSLQFFQQYKFLGRAVISVLIGLFTIWLVQAAFYTFPVDHALGYLQKVENMLYDLRFQARSSVPTPGDVVILDIDQRSMQRFENRWPFSRAEMGKVVRRMTEAGVKVIGWDVLFTSPDNPDEIEATKRLLDKYEELHAVGKEGESGKPAANMAFYQSMKDTYQEMLHDQAFADAIQEAVDSDVSVISAMFFIPEFLKETARSYGSVDQNLFYASCYPVISYWSAVENKEDSRTLNDVKSEIDRFEPSMVGVLSTISPVSEEVSMQGFVNAFPDPDGIVRRMDTAIPYGLEEEGEKQYEFYPPMALQCANEFLAKQTEEIADMKVAWTVSKSNSQIVARARDVTVNNRKLMLNEDGTALLYYYGKGDWADYPEVTVVGAVPRAGTFGFGRRVRAQGIPSRDVLRAAEVPGPLPSFFVRRISMDENDRPKPELHLVKPPELEASTGDGDIALKPGDIVFIPTEATNSDLIQVIGEVKKPGPVAVGGKTLLPSEALEQAGGWSFKHSVDVRRACVIRPDRDSIATPQVFPAFAKGRLREDIPLKAGDILVLPRSYHRGRLFKYYSFIDLYDRQVNLDELKGKVVIVGSTSKELNDFLNSPYGIFPGLEIQATYCQNVIENRFIRKRGIEKYDKWLLTGITLGIAVLAGMLPQVWGTLIFLIISGGHAFLSYLQFQQNGVWYNITAPISGAVIAFSLVTVYRYVTEQREKKKVRGMFSSMVSPDVLEYMEESPDRFRLTGEKKMATMFFSDVAGFTTISESLTAEALALVLNRYLTPMSDIIIRYGGYIDKYEGDAIMADFGVPIWSDPDPDSHAWKACWAAIEQQEKLLEVAGAIEAEFGVKLAARMGLNSGEVAAGNMGSEQKFQYTVMGDAVNQAARFEPANKPFNTLIMIGEPTYQLAKEKIEVRFLAAVIVKGKTEPVKSYELIAKKGEISEEKKRVVQIFEEGWQLHAEWKWDEAIERFEAAFDIDPNDGPSKTYKEICLNYKTEPPENKNWAGEWVQTSK